MNIEITKVLFDAIIGNEQLLPDTTGAFCQRLDAIRVTLGDDEAESLYNELMRAVIAASEQAFRLGWTMRAQA